MHSSLLSLRGIRGIALPALALALAPGALAQAPRNPQEPRNLLKNGSFEHPPVAPGTSASLASAGAWTAAAGALVIHDPVGTPGAFESNQVLELASLAVVRQVCRTRAGQTYSLSLAYCPRPEAGEVAFEIWYAGVLLETVVVPAGSAAVWRHRSHLVVGASSGDAVELRSLEPSALGVLVDDCILFAYDPSVSAQRIRNGSFEDDPRLEADVAMSNPVFVGWYSPELRAIEVKDLGAGGSGFSGKQVMDLDEAIGAAQRVYVVPDRNYTLRAAFSPNPLDDRERQFTVSFGGKLIDTITVPLSPAIAWSTRSWTVTSESPLTTVELRDLSGGFNGTLLDGISLVGPVPELETDGQIGSYKIIAHNPLVGLKLVTDAMFARGITALGDLDGDGVQDLAVGSVGDDDGGYNTGAVWIVFMKADKTPKGSAKISELKGGLAADLLDEDGFGRALTGIGDLDGDGIPDLAVGANEDDSGSTNAGAVYVLFLNRNGTVRAQRKISAISGDPLQFVPGRRSEFGAALAGMGDVDGDGIPDLAIAARFSNSVQVCFMNRDGSVRAATNLTYGQNGFTDSRSSFLDLFGMSCANMGDFDGDGVNDLLVGAFGREYAGQDFVGGQYLVLLNRDGTCKRWHYYGSENINPRSQNLGLHYDLGTACAGPGDIDGDGVRDIVVGAQREGAVWGFDREEGSKNGAVYVLLLNANGTIKTCQRLGDRVGGWDYKIDDGARWGEALAALGDHDANGLVDVAIGSRFVFHTGGVFLCELRGSGRAPLRADFAAVPVSGAAPLSVSFSDRSSGPVAGWAWDFGDGSTSTLANPSHTYAANGAYSVRLTVSAADGTTHARFAPNLVNVSPEGQLPPGVTRLGCGTNPPSSFRILAGSPRLGTSMTFGVDNPFGTQRVGSIASLIASWNADPNRPCGTLVAGAGMSAPGTSGERLIAAPTFATRTGSAWQGPGNPAPVVFQIPSNLSLVGRTLFVQGRLLDGSAGAPIPLALADGFALTLQP
jgi:hypothetical protein